MRVRTGHVSNSSSSSFILVVKNKDMTVKEALSTMKVEANNPFAEIGNDAIDYLISDMEEMDGFEREELIEEEWHDKLSGYAKDGKTLYTCLAGTDGDPGVEPMLAEMELEIDNDDLYLWSEGR